MKIRSSRSSPLPRRSRSRAAARKRPSRAADEGGAAGSPGRRHGGQDRPRRPAHRRHRAPRQGQRERRAPGDRGSQRRRSQDRRQGGEVQAGGGGRPGRSEGRHHRRAEAGRRQSRRRRRPPELRHLDSRLGDLQPGRHPGDLRLGHQSEAHRAGLQEPVPRRRPRRPAGPGDRQLPRRRAASRRSSRSSTTRPRTAKASPTRSRRRSRRAKIKVLPREKGTDKTTDWKAILTKLRGKNPDAVFYGGMDATGGPLLKQGKRARHEGGVRVRRRRLHRRDGEARRRRGRRPAVLAGRHPAAGGDQEIPRRLQEEVQADPILYAPFTYDARTC